MMVLQEIKRRAGFIAGPVLGISLMGYFGYHLVQGERGLLAWLRLTQELKTATAQLAALDDERSTLDHRVGLLRPQHIDRDMLDEEARATLNLAGPHDIVIMRGSLPR
ncbi:MAG TPA: septum formation initiator family protein [Stellaceae bacterium]|nr:septum formation initiator family protein [Stellaceae bacterium]